MKNSDILFKTLISFTIELLCICFILFILQSLTLNNIIIITCVLYIFNMWIYDYNVYNRQ